MALRIATRTSITYGNQHAAVVEDLKVAPVVVSVWLSDRHDRDEVIGGKRAIMRSRHRSDNCVTRSLFFGRGEVEIHDFTIVREHCTEQALLSVLASEVSDIENRWQIVVAEIVNSSTLRDGEQALVAVISNGVTQWG